ncbi:uncharacterized protein LOC143219061 isoform X2 [Lasioglossum baleicum]|uniref:uncharacterized protein LOC143219061 isoform X2 n=1 Tax=Lasioglossum baleicum TaxID=434251 RepID=UPI003FCD377E
MVTVNQLMNYPELNDSLHQLASTFPYTEHSMTKFEDKRNNNGNSSNNKDINVITATQIIVLLLFAFGIFFALLIYCKTCNRSNRARYSDQSRYGNNDDDQQTDTDSLYSHAINESRQRPPSYSEACNAPPLYGSPFNRASMLEAPPVYPDTPKLSDRVHGQGFPVTHHI